MEVYEQHIASMPIQWHTLEPLYKKAETWCEHSLVRHIKEEIGQLHFVGSHYRAVIEVHEASTGSLHASDFI